MPTITIGDLQRLIDSASYDQYSRGRIGAQRPQSAHPKRSQISKSPPASITQSMNRPQSAPKSYAYGQHQKSLTWSHEPKPPRSRPQSAKSALSVCSEEDNLDFTGLSNMMQGLRFVQSKKWKSREKEHGRCIISNKIEQKTNKSKQCFSNGQESVLNERKTDPNILRKSRTSSYSKYRYPLQHHNVKNQHARLILEHSVPPSLRKVSRYINSPVRKNCAYNPPVGPVTAVKKHSLSSNSLPSPRTGKGLTTKPPMPPKSNSPFFEKENNQQEMGITNTNDELERNGSFHYVYNGNPAPDSNVLVETPQRMYTEQDVNTIPQISDNQYEAITTVDSLVHIVNQTDGILVDNNQGINNDQQSNADTDDFFPRDDDDINDILRDEQEEKLSYGDVNDMQSIVSGNDDFVNEGDNVAPSPVFPPRPNHANGNVIANNVTTEDEIESEIEEDIPEDVNLKSFTFNSKR